MDGRKIQRRDGIKKNKKRRGRERVRNVQIGKSENDALEKEWEKSGRVRMSKVMKRKSGKGLEKKEIESMKKNRVKGITERINLTRKREEYYRKKGKERYEVEQEQNIKRKVYDTKREVYRRKLIWNTIITITLTNDLNLLYKSRF